ncbi:hypothetical protein ACIA8K_06480 [Catenuloplanes sp. NPDC051500]|uniref:hypothetical protein n=1 Tax=Catenuloplanes sp. NPDC051500 TaxID=3363959 RepID=UPI00378A5E8E
MADRLDDVFTRFEASVAPTFRPVPVGELTVRGWRRGRRLWTGVLAGALVLLVGAPVGALALGDASPGPGPETVIEETSPYRPYIPGWGYRAGLQFGFGPGAVWAYSTGTCAGELCSVLPGLAVSKDQGNTWQLRPGGEGLRDAELIVSPRGTVYLREPGGDTIEQILPETGASIVMPALPGPPELLLTFGGDLILECPGQETYGGPDALTCDRPEVTDLTTIVKPEVPAGMGRLTQLARAGDGRTWLLGQDGGAVRVSSSADGGKTWDAPVTKESADPIRLTVSPIDGDAWLVAGDPVRVWRLTHDGERQVVEGGDGRSVTEVAGQIPQSDETPFDAAEASMIQARGEGVLAVATRYDGIWAFAPGGGRMQEEFAAVGLDMFTDGTAVARNGDGRCLISTGHGWERTETWLEP